MIKKSASRNQRSKGAKVKHVLQILLLLCICFWLLYQIKRSYDRKRDMIEKDSKALVNGNDEDGDLKLGRKDPHVKRQEEEDEEKGKDEDEEEGKDEDEGSRGERDDVEVDEDEIRQEIERNEERERQEGQKEEGDEEAVDNREEEEDGREEEEDNNKMDEAEDERGGDNADLNEAGEEVTEVETTDPEEDFLDEDKGGREEMVNDGVEEDKGEGRREEHVREDDRSEDKDRDEVSENSHEAREVHYREDNASSAVAHNTEADNRNADLVLNKPGMESNSTVSIPQDLTRESLEATPGNKEEGKSNVSEVVDIQASNVVPTGGTELTRLVSNVSETVTSLPQAQSLTTPDSGSGEVSLEQVTGVKLSNASTDEKTANVSAKTNSSNQIDTTPSTSNKEPYKPLDPSNNQTLVIPVGVTSLDQKQELDDDSKELSTGGVNDDMIKMQLPEKQDGGESRTQ